jgi:glycosyltransferase involved in cell wall biosynthesis
MSASQGNLIPTATFKKRPAGYRIGVIIEVPSVQMAAQYEALLSLSEFEFVLLFRLAASGNSAWKPKFPEGMESLVLPPCNAWYLPRRVRGRFNAGVKQILDERNFDAMILHGHYDHMTLWQAIHWCRKHGRPYLVRNDANATKEKSPLRRWRNAFFARNLTGAAGMLVIGTKNREYYELYGAHESQFFMAPWEIDYPQLEAALPQAIPQRNAVRAKMGIKPDDVAIICVARLEERKGVGNVIEAVRRVAQHGVPMRLLIVGEGPHRPTLERQIAQTNAPAKLCGNLGRMEVVSAMVAADVFVLASQWEPWALVVNEACLCGLPLVLSDQVGAAADLLVPGENGFVFPAGDIDALTRSLEVLARDAAKRQEMGRRSAEILAHWRSQYPASAGYRDALRYAFSGRWQCNAQSTKEDGL